MLNHLALRTAVGTTPTSEDTGAPGRMRKRGNAPLEYRFVHQARPACTQRKKKSVLVLDRLSSSGDAMSPSDSSNARPVAGARPSADERGRACVRRIVAGKCTRSPPGKKLLLTLRTLLLV